MYSGPRNRGQTYRDRCHGLLKKKCNIDACFITKLPSDKGAECKQSCLDCAYAWVRQFVTHVDATWQANNPNKNYVVWQEAADDDEDTLVSTIREIHVFIVMTLCDGGSDKVYDIPMPLSSDTPWTKYQDLLYQNMSAKTCKALHFVVDFDISGVRKAVPPRVVRQALNSPADFPDLRVRRLLKAGGRLEYDGRAEVLAMVFDNSVRGPNQTPVMYLTMQEPPNQPMWNKIEAQLKRVSEQKGGTRALGFARLWLARSRMQHESSRAQRVEQDLVAMLSGDEQMTSSKLREVRSRLHDLVLPADTIQDLEELFASAMEVHETVEKPHARRKRRWWQTVRRLRYLYLEPMALLPETPPLPPALVKQVEHLRKEWRWVTPTKDVVARKKFIESWEGMYDTYERVLELHRSQQEEKLEQKFVQTRLQVPLRSHDQYRNAFRVLQLALRSQSRRVTLQDPVAWEKTSSLMAQAERLLRFEQAQNMRAPGAAQLKAQLADLNSEQQRQQAKDQASADTVMEILRGNIPEAQVRERVQKLMAAGNGLKDCALYVQALHEKVGKLSFLREYVQTAEEKHREYQEELWRQNEKFIERMYEIHLVAAHTTLTDLKSNGLYRIQQESPHIFHWFVTHELSDNLYDGQVAEAITLMDADSPDADDGLSDVKTDIEYVHSIVADGTYTSTDIRALSLPKSLPAAADPELLQAAGAAFETACIRQAENSLMDVTSMTSAENKQHFENIGKLFNILQFLENAVTPPIRVENSTKNDHYFYSYVRLTQFRLQVAMLLDQKPDPTKNLFRPILMRQRETQREACDIESKMIQRLAQLLGLDKDPENARNKVYAKFVKKFLSGFPERGTSREYIPILPTYSQRGRSNSDSSEGSHSEVEV